MRLDFAKSIIFSIIDSNLKLIASLHVRFKHSGKRRANRHRKLDMSNQEDHLHHLMTFADICMNFVVSDNDIITYRIVV